MISVYCRRAHHQRIISQLHYNAIMILVAAKMCLRMVLGTWLDVIYLRNVFDSVRGVGCVEQPVTPFERTTGDGDDECEVEHTHGWTT